MSFCLHTAKEYLTIAFKPFHLLFYLLGVVFFDWLDFPEKATLILVTLMTIDTFTGMLKVARWKRKEWSTHNLGIGIMSKILTFVVLATCSLVSQMTLDLYGINIGIEHILSISIGLFGMAEAISILQNVYIYRTGNWVKEVDLVSAIIRYIQSTIREFLEKILAKKDNL
jgi:phage-related holin